VKLTLKRRASLSASKPNTAAKRLNRQDGILSSDAAQLAWISWIRAAPGSRAPNT